MPANSGTKRVEKIPPLRKKEFTRQNRRVKWLLRE